MPALTTTERLPTYVSFSDVEQISARLEAVESLTIELSAFRRARLFAEAGLLSLITLARTLNKEVFVQLGGTLPAPEGASGRRYWKIFCESISGFVLGQLADAIFDGSGADVTSVIRREQSRQLRASNGYIGSGKEVAAAIADRFGAPTSAQIVRERNATNFNHLLAYTLAVRLGIRGEPGGASLNLSMFASELLENTRDHATTDLNELPIEGVRFLNVRRINPDQEDIGDLTVGTQDSNAFIESIKAVLLTAKHAEHLIEITVADSGPGIAARMAHSKEIYEGPIQFEREQVLSAIAKGGSSKPASVTGCGLGLQNVLDATRALGGLLVIRTGRTRLFYYYDPATVQGDGVRGTNDSALPFLPGTSVSLLIPWKVRDEQLDLFRVTDADANRGR